MKELLHRAATSVSSVILGKEEQVRLAIACFISRGHLLIEDLPGMGKTTLAHALARVFDMQFRRVQFTSDMLPADVLGVSVYDPESGGFTLKEGPIFTQLLLADEINRATPKTQSALLEAMEEGQVSLDGVTRRLPEPFFVVATQNPVSQAGTFPLPESQLDRFLMRITLGYPSAEVEKELLGGRAERDQSLALAPVIGRDQLNMISAEVEKVRASADLIDYVQRLLEFSRTSGMFVNGLSPRAGLGLLRAAKAMALTAGRDYAIPEDVQVVLGPVCEHRLAAASGAGSAGAAEILLQSVDVIRAR